MINIKLKDTEIATLFGVTINEATQLKNQLESLEPKPLVVFSKKGSSTHRKKKSNAK